jgi:group I intron endonuclease
MGFIYKITNTINNKAYIGITIKTPEERWKGHLKAIKSGKGCPLLRSAVNKHGTDKFKIDTLIICFDDDLYRFEKDYIKKYNTLAPNGYNAHEGGECGGNFTGKTHSQETREKIGKVSHKIQTEMTEEERAIQSKRISDGLKKSEKWKKAIEEGRVVWKTEICGKGAIKGVKKGPLSQETKDKISKSVKEYFNSTNRVVNNNRKINHSKTMLKVNGRKVEQYSLQNILIKVHNSIKEASSETGVGAKSIQANVAGKSKTSGGFIWKYVSSESKHNKTEEYKERQKKVTAKSVGRKVEQYSLNNKLIKIYDTIAEASRQTKTAPSTIREVALGKGKTAGGFIWKFPTTEPKEATTR